MIKFKTKGDLKKTKQFLSRIGKGDYKKGLDYFGKAGVAALYVATPKATGKTASSWYYSIEENEDGLVISWNNSNVVRGISIALLIQKGHGTASGYYVQGVDYINPALKPIFEALGEELWTEVTKNA